MGLPETERMMAARKMKLESWQEELVAIEKLRDFFKRFGWDPEAAEALINRSAKVFAYHPDGSLQRDEEHVMVRINRSADSELAILYFDPELHSMQVNIPRETDKNRLAAECVSYSFIKANLSKNDEIIFETRNGSQLVISPAGHIYALLK